MSNPFSLKIKKVKREQKWERSCFFGACDIPTMFLHICEPDEFFFAQFNLEEMTKVYNSYLLPNEGMLYFFITKNDFKPIIRYYHKNGYDEEIKARVDFNNCIQVNFDILTEYKIKFIHSYKRLPMQFLDEDSKYGEMKPDEIILLRYDSSKCVDMFGTKGILLFVINKNDLLKRDYSSIRIITIHQ